MPTSTIAEPQGLRRRGRRRRRGVDDGDALRAEVRAWLDRHPHPTGAELAERGPRRPALAARPGVSARTRPPSSCIDEELRAAGRAPPDQPDRHRVGRPDARSRAAPTAQQRRWLPGILSGEAVLVPAVQRARRGQRPRVAAHPRGARRRRVGRHRPEDLDELRARRDATGSCSRAPTPTPRRTRGSRTSSARCTLAGHRGRARSST